MLFHAAFLIIIVADTLSTHQHSFCHAVPQAHSATSESRLREYTRKKGTFEFRICPLCADLTPRLPERLEALPQTNSSPGSRRPPRQVAGMQAFKNMATNAIGGGPAGPAGPQAGSESVPSGQNNDSNAQQPQQQQQQQPQQQQSQNANGSASQVPCRFWC